MIPAAPHRPPAAVVLIPFGFLIVSVALTWPLALTLADRIPHDAGDPPLLTYILQGNATALPFTAAWCNPPFFWPETNVIAFSDHLLGLSLLAWPL